jgi:hypothetical protein
MHLLPCVEGHVVCCWADGLVAAYKRSQLFALSVWTLQLSHRTACTCTCNNPAVIVAATVGGSCSVVSAADGIVLRTFVLGPIVLMHMFATSATSLVTATRDGRIMLFNIDGPVVCKDTLSLGCPLLHVSASADGLLSVVKSNGCTQLVDVFADDFALLNRGSVVCLKAAVMSVVAGERN